MHKKSCTEITRPHRRTRLSPKLVYYYRCPDHRKNYVMSFAFAFDREHDVYQFAYAYPYSYTRLQNYLAAVEKRDFDYFKRDLLCLSVVSTSPYSHYSLYPCCSGDPPTVVVISTEISFTIIILAIRSVSGVTELHSAAIHCTL